MSSHSSTGTLERTVADVSTQAELKEPRGYKVVILNDDYTPMPFVVEVLKRFFYMTHEVATGVMLEVHFRGKGVCGVFTRDIAETKIAFVNEYARAHEHPLLCSMEPE